MQLIRVLPTALPRSGLDPTHDAPPPTDRSDPWAGLLALAGRQHNVATRAQAGGAGLDRNRVRRELQRGRLTEPVPGVLVIAGTPASFRQRLGVATLAGGGTVASHRAAALLHGFDGITSAPIEITVRRGRYPSIDGVVVHRASRLDHRDIAWVDGLAVTSPNRTLCDLGAVLAQDDVERCVDGALRRGTTERALRETLDRVRRPGPTGTATLDRILSDPRRTGGIPESWFERLLRRALAAADLPPIVLQHPVRDPSGRVVARFDAALPAWRIGIEAHSAAWHDRPGRVWRDLERDNSVKALGWTVVYVTWSLARRPDDVLALIRRTHANWQPRATEITR